MARTRIAIRRRYVQTEARPSVLVVFPFDGSITRHPLSSTGSPQGRIPLLHGYYGMLRLPTALPDALRCLRLPVPPATDASLPSAVRGAPTGRGLWLPLRFPPCGSSRMETAGPLKFLEDPCVRALLSDPGGTFTPGHTACRCGLPLLAQRRLPRLGSFEAQSHGPHTRCLRFAGRITPPPRKTRFRLSATLCRTGCFLLQGPNERFQPCLTTSPPPFPSFP